MSVLVEVSGNERALVLVEGTTDEKTAKKAAYFALFGEPRHPEEEPTEATIAEHTHVVRYCKVKVG
jgi:hypothetical protein